MKNIKKGFTILELLVAIAIIATLMAVILVTLTDTNAKARDSKRAGDIKQIQNALQLYYTDHQGFPATLDEQKLVPEYIKSIPKDPAEDHLDYLYAAIKVGGRCTSYHLGAVMETVNNNTGVLETDFDKLPTNNICNGSASDFDGGDPVYDVAP